MRAIVIGAGRGQRLMPTTANAPKCFSEIGGRRIIDYILSALRDGGATAITFIGGYRIDAVQQDYPDLDFVENPRWAETNILASLMCAEDRMNQGFVSTYADVVYRGEAVRRLLATTEPIVVLLDTGWRARYVHRSEHPPHDAEKVMCERGRIARIHRDIEPDRAYGEFTGVAKFTAEGAEQLRQAYHRCKDRHGNGPFREAPSLDHAYLIQLLQEMIESGVRITHVDTAGGYHEIDTQQDYDLARAAHAAGERWG